MREHITTILPGAAFAAMLVLVLTSLGQSQLDPESRLYARAADFCHAMGEGDVEAALRFFHQTNLSPEALEVLRMLVQTDLEQLRGVRFVVTAVEIDGDRGDVWVYWATERRTTLFQSAVPWVRLSGDWLIATPEG